TRTIYITKGMLFAIQNEAQLAELIGHEIGHLKTGENSSSEKVVTNLVDSVIDSAVGSDVAKDDAREVERAQFSQANEENADKFGVTAAASLGYDPYELANLFDTLWVLSGKNALDIVRSVTATHPALDVRATKLRIYLKQNGYGATGQKFAQQYIRHVSH